MGFANVWIGNIVRSSMMGAVITDKTTKLKIRIPMWSTVA